MKKTKKIGSVIAQGSDGEGYMINIFSDSIKSLSSSGTHVLLGQMFLKTSTGIPVNYKAKGRYEIVTAFGVIELKSDDPKAP